MPALNAPCLPLVGLDPGFSPSEPHPLEAPLPNHPLDYIPAITHHVDVTSRHSDVICSGDIMEVDNNCNQMGPPLGAPPMHGSKMELYNNNGHSFPVPNLSLGTNQKEICAGCRRPIEDRFLLRVMDNSWHETCLQCSMCQEPLQRSCFVKDRKLLCKGDYDKLYGARCHGCLQPIPAHELVMRALGQVYHLRCFSCAVCRHQLQKGDQFVVKDGLLYCRLDFEKEYSLMTMSPKADWSDDDSSLDGDNCDLDAPKGPKRPRTILTTSQRRKFKASFEINPKPCRKVRETLAAETGLSVRVVQVWFQNQRAKMKKLARRQTSDGDKDGKPGAKGQKHGGKKKKDDDDDASPSSNENVQDLYSSSMSESLYGSSLGIDSSLDTLGDMLMGQTPPAATPSGQGHVGNPIDKLYSMQSSYFTAD